MNTVVPRFEFRTFGQSLERIESALRARSECREITESDEYYLIDKDDLDINIKARDDRLEIKRLVERRGQLQLWKPVLTEHFPVPRAVIRTQLLPFLHAEAIELRHDPCTLQELIDEVVRPAPSLHIARVVKRRCKFEVDGCPAEIDEVSINNHAMRSVAVEAADPEALAALVRELELDRCENLGYPRAIGRLLGL